jgi:hypothetical protein
MWDKGISQNSGIRSMKENGAEYDGGIEVFQT